MTTTNNITSYNIVFNNIIIRNYLIDNKIIIFNISLRNIKLIRYAFYYAMIGCRNIIYGTLFVVRRKEIIK